MAKSLRNTTMKVNIQVNSKALDEANHKIDSSIHSAGKLENSANKSGKAIEQAGRKFANARDSIEKNTSSLKNNASHAKDVNRQHSNLVTSAKKAGDSFRDQKRSIDDSTKSLKDFNSIAGKINDTIKTIGSAYLVSKMYDIGKAAIGVGMEFDKQMSAVQAISGATSDQFKKMRDQAIDLGASSTKSASEVASGQLEMAKAGFSVNQTMAAMPGLISASAASGEDMARTTEVVTAALNGFQMNANSAGHISDVLAQTANKTKADINDLGYAFKYAATPAHTLGYSLESVAAATGIMTNAGLAGEQAGTSLRMSLISLAQPSEKAANLMDDMGLKVKDSKGNMLPLVNIISQLAEKTKGMGNAQKLATMSTLVGTEAASGMLAVVNAGPKKLDALTKSLQNSDGASAKAAKTMQDNLAGSVEQMKGAFESAAISVSDTLTPTVRKGVDAVSDIVGKFNDLSPSAKATVVWGSIIVGGILPVVYTFYKVRKAVKSVSEIMDGAKGFFSSYRGEMAATGREALVMASQIKEANAIIESSQPTTSSSTPSTTKSYSELMKEAHNKKIKGSAGPAIEEAVEDTKKGGFLSKVGSRVSKGMQFTSKASKAVPLVGTLLSATQLLGMNSENSGDKLGGFGGSLAGGATGAAIGSAIAPGIGTAIGGSIGAFAGSSFGEKFGSYVQKQWPKVKKNVEDYAKSNPLSLVGVIAKSQELSRDFKEAFKDPLNTTINFGKSVKSSTSKAINSYMDLESKSKVQLSLLATNGEKYSKSARDSLNKNFQSMASLVEKSLSKTQKSTKSNLSVLAKNGLLSDKDVKAIEKKQQDTQKKQLKAVQDSAKKMVQINNDAYKKEQSVTKSAEDKINAIKEKAAKQGRTLTQSEQNKIKKIESDAANKRKKIAQDAQQAISKEEEKERKNVVASLSKSAKEQKLILGKLEDDSGKISAKQASSIVKNAEKARKGAVSEANEKYKKVKDAADQEYYVNGTISKAQHDKIVKEAKETRDESISHANDMKEKIVKAAQDQAKGHLKEIDWETGQTLSKWDQHKISLSKIWNSVTGAINKVLSFLHLKTIPEWHPAGSSAKSMPTNATGTPYHPGGKAVVGEEGYELAYIPYKGATLLGQNGAEIVDLPQGTRILPHAQTKQMLNGGLKGQMPGYASGTLGAAKEFLSGAWDKTTSFVESAVSKTEDVVESVKKKTKKVASAAWNKAKSVGNDAKGLAEAVAEWIAHPIKKTNAVFDKYLPISGDIGYGEGLGTGILKYASTGVQKYLSNQFKDMAGDTSGGAAAPAQVKKWLLTAMSITGTPASYLGALTKVAMHESGGNPRAINLWDSNAKAGHPSKGLMQTIDSTFNTYKIAGLGDIYNPVANAVAAIRYMNARYGSIANVPGVKSAKYVGYKNGGRKFGNDPVLVGENGPEIADLPDGTQIHNANKTQDLLKQQKGNITIHFSPVIKINIDGGNDAIESKINRAVRDALERAFKDFIPIIDSGVAY